MKVSTEWLKEYVNFSGAVKTVAENLTMAGLEVKEIKPAPNQPKVQLFDVEVTSNRPDWCSHIGVAREIAAVENLKLKKPQIAEGSSHKMPPGWKVALKEAEGCPYYTAVLLEGVEMVKTPDFIADRLAACGIRTINLVVDITNYVLLETGQPLHAFDADLLQGQVIQIRRAKAGEGMAAIDGHSYKLQEQDLVIADQNRPVALAGIMGGKETEVSAKTRNILLESAFFNPGWVRKTSKKLGLSTDSSYRFERRVDPEGVDFGSKRALYLLMKYAKPRFVSAVLKAGQAPAASRKKIHLGSEDIIKLLGAEIKPREAQSILSRLGLDVSRKSAGNWSIGIPSFRPDLVRQVDVIEEIARIYGYDKIPSTLPSRAPLLIAENSRRKLEEKVRSFIAGAGLFETVTFSLISEKGLDPEKDLSHAVGIVNPMNKELRWMRPVLFPSLLSVMQSNFAVGAGSVRLFEIANTYRKGDQGKKSHEERTLGIALSGNHHEDSWLDVERGLTYYDLKGLLQNLLESLGIGDLRFKECGKSFLSKANCRELLIEGEPFGFMGEATPRQLKSWDIENPVYYAEISLDKLAGHVVWIRSCEEVTRFPSIVRDISLVVKDEVKVGEIAEEVRKAGGDIVQSIKVFDVYRGDRVPEGCKNIAFKVIYQQPDRTLVSEEVQKIHAQIADGLAKKYRAQFQ